jgi:adenylate cyclase
MKEKISKIKRLIPVDIGAAREGAASLLQTADAGGNDHDRADVYHLTGLVHFYSDEARDAVKWYNKEIKLREKLKDGKGASDAYNNIGAIYYNNGELNKAKEYYEKALAYREKINDRRGIAGCYDNIGAALLKSGRAAEALDMHFRALRINQAMGDSERIGFSLQNIGLAYLTQGDYDYALQNYSESLAIAEKNNDKVRAIQLMINIGTVFVKQNNPEQAKKYYNRCHEESSSIDYQFGLVFSLYNLADIELREGHYQDCIRRYTDCINIARTGGQVAQVIAALSGIGRAYYLLNDFDQSHKYLKEALAMAKKTAFKESISDIYLLLSEIHEKKACLSGRQGDSMKALQYYKEYISLRDDMVNKETSQTINEIKTRYEVDKKQKEAEISRLRNIELKNALDALTSAKEQSDHLLLNILPRDVADELKAKGSVTARYFEQAAVMFLDVKDFTLLSEHLSPAELVSVIDVYFSLFDSIIGEYRIEKIKTIGDAYLCAAGLPTADPQSAITAVGAAIHIRDAIAKLNKVRLASGLLCFEFRIGLHAGPVIAGVVGRRKFEYDIWGDTVNTAARMEQHSEPGKINISQTTYELVKDKFTCTYRGEIEAKNKGKMKMYFVNT